MQKLRDFVGNHTMLIIDEAQYIEQVGLNLKLIVDHIPNIKVVATGSSSFSLAKDVGEPLTGRKFTLKLYPLAQLELSEVEPRHETLANLESRLIYGSYPEVVLSRDNHQRELYLRELVNAYLFKDILELEGIRYSNKLLQLLQLIAYQIGKNVSVYEIGQQLAMSKNTVERYIDLLEKVFVLVRRNAFSRNLRKEIARGYRLYFLDNGIRNALIGNFNPLSMRDDVGILWENYVVMERLKRNEILQQGVNSYFWRTYNRKEIDLVEESRGTLAGYEIKWKPSKIKPPKEWLTAYPRATFQVVHPENYLDFIS